MIVQCYIINCEDSFDMILFSNLLGFVYIYLYTFIHSSRHSSPINMTSLLCLWSYEKLFFTCKFDNKLFTLKLSCVCPMYTRNKRKYVYIGFFNLFFSSSICCQSKGSTKQLYQALQGTLSSGKSVILKGIPKLKITF